MSGSAAMALGGLVSGLSVLLVWVTHWPLQPLSADQAGAIAGLVITGVGIAWHWKPPNGGVKP